MCVLNFGSRCVILNGQSHLSPLVDEVIEAAFDDIIGEVNNCPGLGQYLHRSGFFIKTSSHHISSVSLALQPAPVLCVLTLLTPAKYPQMWITLSIPSIP